MEIQVASPRAAERACSYILAQVKAGKPMVVSVEPPQRVRSLKANARYWVLLGLIAAHIAVRRRHFLVRTWHEYFKQRYLTPEEIELPNGRSFLKYPSTKRMKHQPFLDYMAQVEVWAAERGVIMEDPQ